MEIALEKVCYIVIKAREFDVKVEPVEENRGSNPADEGMRDVLADYPDDPTYEELKGLLDSLNRDELVDLLALVWVGRGDYTAQEWPEVVTQARSILDKRAPDYLLGIPLLADFLEEGLNALGFSCEDEEKEHL
ncbi:MAG TPA: DUF3775 domain-containing protein [Alphaproteobacteria bacterium]|jgi:hypothetical protein|nr:DUF3775 domain-containing protein [Alphaproteobacteria bacterium]